MQDSTTAIQPERHRAFFFSVCLSYLGELSQLLTLLIHSGLQQHVVHHTHQLDHFQSATGPPEHTEDTHARPYYYTVSAFP